MNHHIEETLPSTNSQFTVREQTSIRGGGIKSILRMTLLLYKKLYHNFPPSLLQRDLQLFIRVTCTEKEEIS